jgi:site-specific DNA-cytosine methylase
LVLAGVTMLHFRTWRAKEQCLWFHPVAMFRMLTSEEIKTAMAFPPDYVITGNKREQVRQLGNAVTPPVMQ